MARRKRRINKQIEKVEPKYTAGSLSKTNEFVGHKDIISALFSSQDLITKSDLQKALKTHLEREV